MAKCNSLYIDVAGLYYEIQNRCYLLLIDVAEKIIKEFGEYIVEAGAGRPLWRRNAASEFKIISDNITRDVISLEVGMPEGLEAEAWTSFYAAQIMVALYGNHPPGGGYYTRPGDITFHEQMENFDQSDPDSGVRRLPEGWNWDDPHPEKMLENSMKRVKQYFMDGISKILDGLNIANYVHVG